MHIEVQVGIKINDLAKIFLRNDVVPSSEQGDLCTGPVESLFRQKIHIKWHTLTVLDGRKQTDPPLTKRVCYPQNLTRMVS